MIMVMIGIFMFISSRGGLMMMITTCIAMFEQVFGGRLYVGPTWRSWFRFSHLSLIILPLLLLKSDLRILMILKIWAIRRIWLSYITSSPPLLPAFQNISRLKQKLSQGLTRVEQGLNKGWTKIRRFSRIKWIVKWGLSKQVSFKKVILRDYSICQNHLL